MPANILTDPYLDHIDWVNVWKARKQRQLSTPHYLNSLDFWSDEENVRRLYSRNGNSRKQLAKEQIAGMVIPAGAGILDIGAGPGTLSVPLAKMGYKVTAIEPSGPMAKAFEEYREQEKVGNISLIQKTWENVEEGDLEGQFDIVIASYSLSMIEIGECLVKMNTVCRGSVYLFWFMTPLPSSLAMHDLWPKVHGSPYYYEPLADCLYLALLQLGFFPDIEVSKSSHAHRYATIGDAVDDFHKRMNCTSGKQDSIIRQYLRSHLCASGKDFQLRGSSMSAKIHWNARP